MVLLTLRSDPGACVDLSSTQAIKQLKKTACDFEHSVCRTWVISGLKQFCPYCLSDILGDGIVHPVQLIQGPQWMRGFKGNEFQRLIRRLKFQGPMLKNMFPTRYHNIKKRLFFLYKRLNRRKRAPFWGGRGSGKLHRRTNLDRIFWEHWL